MSGPALFGRVCTVQIDTIKSDNSRVVFEIPKSRSRKPNKVKISIYNLTQPHRSQLDKQNVFISIDAGYQQQHSTIFNGYVRAIEHVRDDTNWITKTTGGDGEVPIRTTRISKSWAAKTPVSVVLNDLAKATTINAGNVGSVASAGQFRKGIQSFARGFVAFGSAYDALADLSFSLGYQLSVQSGCLQMVPITAVVQKSAVLLNGRSGLRGSPEVGEKGIIKAISSLNGSFFPGRQVKLESNRYNGFYGVHKVTHKGDTHSTDPNGWVSELELYPITNNATVASQ